MMTNPCTPQSRLILSKQSKPLLEVSSRYSETDLNDRPLSAISFITKKENDDILSKELKRKLSKQNSKIKRFEEKIRSSNVHAKLTMVGDLVKQI